MKTLVELKDEIRALGEEGKAAAIACDFDKCVELAKKSDPLLRELGQRTGDEIWAQIADKGQKLISEQENGEELR